MSPARNECDLSPQITDKFIAKLVSEALRMEHADIYSATKQIERITGISALTASNWYRGRYAPNLRHFLKLAACYPLLLKTLCDLTGRDDVWRNAVERRVVNGMRDHLNEHWRPWKRGPSNGDKHVTIHVRISPYLIGQMNHRQLWFVGQLQQGHKVHLNDLMEVWNIHRRTARRDLAGMIEAKVIMAIRSGRTCRYKLP